MMNSAVLVQVGLQGRHNKVADLLNSIINVNGVCGQHIVICKVGVEVKFGSFFKMWQRFRLAEHTAILEMLLRAEKKNAISRQRFSTSLCNGVGMVIIWLAMELGTAMSDFSVSSLI